MTTTLGGHVADTSAPHLADEPHHDGSALYTDEGPYTLGATIAVRLRVPVATGADRVRVRTTPDAEPDMIEAEVVRTEAGAMWWEAKITLHNPNTAYRFLLEGGAIGYGWLTQSGLVRRDVSDATDFTISTLLRPPSWLDGTIGYQIFLDRFARSAAGHETQTPDWATAADWNEPLAADPDVGTRQWYGGDLGGVEEHLDHLERLGVNLVYLTPFFPAGSAHRYDAASFDEVDPALGGDAALESLIDAAHDRGIRVIGDITLNHIGDRHHWFQTARADRTSTEAGFFMFGDDAGESRPDGLDYVAWHDVPSLPKLDHRSTELGARLYRGDRSVVARFLDEPFGLDGWRVDCANTTGRWADIDTNHAVAADTLATIEAHRPDGWLLAEHCFDAGADLTGGGWHGVMAYQWFTRPIWSWLRGEQAYTMMSQIELPHLDGNATVASMRELGGTASWRARAASMTMLDSHDSARFRTAVGGDHLRHVIGLAALLTMPGVPTLFAGSEVGVVGDTMDTCRVPFPWDDSTWDHDLIEAARALIALRSDSPALQRGSLRWIGAGRDSITYVRELPDERVLVHLNRCDTAASSVPITALDGSGTASPRFGHRLHIEGSSIVLPGAVGVSIADV